MALRTLGLVGGMSWVSTLDYYRYINEGVHALLGGNNFAKCIIYSFNYADIQEANNTGNGDDALILFEDACGKLEAAGAAAIVLCANTAHRFARRLSPQFHIPIIHIGTATANTIAATGLSTVALLGTKFTMELDFIKDELALRGIRTLIPAADDRAFIHHTIHAELGKGIISNETKSRYLQIINDLVNRGAQGVILGCTEIPLLISQADLPIQVFDTTRIHAAAAVTFATGLPLPQQP